MIILRNADDQARALQKALSELGYSVEPELVSKRVVEMHGGLVQEDEFLYTLNWLKNVVLAHKIEQFPIPADAKRSFTIPDLFLVVNVNGQQQPYFVEIKTSQEDKIKWRPSYYEGLQNYSALTGVPVLVAWKWRSFDIWTLVRLEDFEQREPGANFKLDLNIAHKRNLMSSLLGDFLVDLPEQFALVMKQRKIKEGIEDGKKVWETIVERVYFQGRDGIEVELKNNGVFAVFHCLGVEDIVEEDDTHLYYKIYPSPNHGLFAQTIPVRLTEHLASEPVNWLERIRNQEFPVQYDKLLEELTAGIEEGLVDHIIYTKVS
jgi:Holliday junction resolvase